MAPWPAANIKAKPPSRAVTEPNSHTTPSGVTVELREIKAEYNRLCCRVGIAHPTAVALGDAIETIECVLNGRTRSRSRSR